MTYVYVYIVLSAVNLGEYSAEFRVELVSGGGKMLEETNFSSLHEEDGLRQFTKDHPKDEGSPCKSPRYLSAAGFLGAIQYPQLLSQSLGVPILLRCSTPTQ